MRALLFGSLALSLFVGLALAAPGSNAWLVPAAPLNPAQVDSGGPDTYGYRWKQTADPGGPLFTWCDISAVGTLVSGLGDDNYVGPFPIGFPFHYYWYEVTQYYIGSNGYIEFSQPFNAASPFPNNIPMATLPNDFLAPYMADFDLSEWGGGTCHRWNNADSCIIQWTDIPFWNYGGSHNFEIIMSRLDSNITYEYGANIGISGNPDFLVGIENITGTIGLKYSNDAYPASNNAIKFYHPAIPGTVIHDLEASAAGNATSEGFFLLSGASLAPMGIVKNVGNATETSFQVNCTIQVVGGAVVYNQTQTINTVLPPMTEQTINFTPSWTAAANGTYYFKITTTLPGDLNPANNLKSAEMHVLALPGTLLYDDGTAELPWDQLRDNTILANHFVPPVYPAYIDSLRFYVADWQIIPNAHPFIAQILDDDGPDGTPGTVLFTQTVNAPTVNQWYGTAANVVINDGGFYVSWQPTDSLSVPLGQDMTTTQPISRQAWKFDSTWMHWQYYQIGDLMIRARIHTDVSTPDLSVTLTPVNPPITIPAAGGSFEFSASVQRILGPQAPFYVWARDRWPYPEPVYTPILLGPVQINPPVGQQVTRLRVQNVPGTWPAGVHYYIGYANPTVAYPAVDADSFSWTKLTTGADGPGVWDATCTGEPFPGEEIPPLSRGDRGDLVAVSPNPFNPVTAISYQLQATSQVRLTVYDTAGRLVSTLVDGMQETGTHQAVFEGAGLSAGIYFVRLQAGGMTQTSKIVLLK